MSTNARALRSRRAEGRPRLLILTPDFPPDRGGIQLVLHRLAAGMSGFETVVLAPDTEAAREFDAASGLRVKRVRGGGQGRARRNAILNAIGLLEAASLRPHLTLSGHIVVSPAAAAIRRLLGAQTAQYFYAEEIAARPRLAAFAAAHADLSIAISAYTSDLVTATGATPRRLCTVPPGVDIPPEVRSLPSAHPTILTIARLEERYKGHDTLLRAFALVRAKLPDAQWVVIGDGSLRPGLEQMARSYGVADAVRFLGAVSDDQRDAWLDRTDVLAMPSRLPAGSFAGEGFGIVYLEAAAHGKPAVAGNVGGALDAIVQRETGLLVDPDDPLGMADALTELLVDREMAARLGAAGRARAEQFAWPKVVARVEALLLALVAGSSRPAEPSGAPGTAG
jgi:phosphatidyl-myo-inositol dimannoside synthase